MKCCRGIFFILILLFCFTASANAAQEGIMRPQPTQQPSESRAPERTMDGKYYLDFKDAPLIHVLSVLSKLSGINFVAGNEISQRKVNMTLDGADLDDVLLSINYGCNVSYDFIPGKNIYFFRASSNAAESPALVTKVFKLYYVRVAKMREISASSSSGGGGSSSGSGSSSTGLQTLEQDDDNTTESTAIQKSIENILSERGKVSFDDRSNSLIVTDYEDRLRMVESAIMQLDRPLDQVLINVLLVETYEDLDRDLGVEWGDSNGIFGTVSGSSQSTNFPFNNDSTQNPFIAFADLAKDSAKQFNFTKATGATTPGTRDFSSFQIKVKALETASRLKILAKPKILAMDNHPALIKIATNAAIGEVSTTSGSSDAGSVTTSEAERAEVGTILRVTPLINSSNRITLTVEPTFATVDQSVISIKSDGQTGDPTVRTARTTMMVNDGQTIAIGGMLFSTQQNADRKVPFFSSIPLFGKALFTSKGKTINDRELILFVTPYIITDPSLLEAKKGTPDNRAKFDDAVAPFWQVKKQDWYRELKEPKTEKTDFEDYFNVRDRLMAQALGSYSEEGR